MAQMLSTVESRAVCPLPSITVSIDAWREIRVADTLSALTPQEVNCVLRKIFRPGNVLINGSWARQSIDTDGSVVITDLEKLATAEWTAHHPSSYEDMLQFARTVVAIVVRTQPDGLPERD